MAVGSELRRLHDHIRSLLDDSRDGAVLSAASLDTDLLVHCRAFCAVLAKHHDTEHAVLFPWLDRTHPSLRSTVVKLEEDHALIGGLLRGLSSDLERGADGPPLGESFWAAAPTTPGEPE